MTDVLEKLQFVKLKFPRLIAEELIDSVKGRTYSLEQFYKYQEEQVKYKNPGNLLYALIDEEKKIQGYFWAEISQLDGSMFINTFSIRKEYWFKGEAMPKVHEFIGQLKERHGCQRVFWITTNEKFFLKHGLRRSKNVLMELK